MYKIIQDNKVIDIVEHPQFVRFLSTGHIAFTDKSSAQGLAKDGILYSFDKIPKVNTIQVSIKKINKQEFSRLCSLLNSKQEIHADESALAEAQRIKIAQLSAICKNKIISGFSVKLSDNNIYNFKLTLEDQINLASIESQLIAGNETFIYHATDQPCQIFNKSDMLKIINCFKKHTLYHTTYFNAAKQYIKKLTNLEKINKFMYGTDITKTVENIVLKQILLNGEDDSNEG